MGSIDSGGFTLLRREDERERGWVMPRPRGAIPYFSLLERARERRVFAFSAACLRFPRFLSSFLWRLR